MVNVTFTEVCLQFHIINGSSTTNVYVLYSMNEYCCQVVSIPRNNELVFTHCDITDIPVGNNLTLYACELIVDCTSNPAAIITGINISEAPMMASSALIKYKTSLSSSFEEMPPSDLMGSFSSMIKYAGPAAIASSECVVNNTVEECAESLVSGKYYNNGPVYKVYFY